MYERLLHKFAWQPILFFQYSTSAYVMSFLNAHKEEEIMLSFFSRRRTNDRTESTSSFTCFFVFLCIKGKKYYFSCSFNRKKDREGYKTMITQRVI